MPGLLGPGAFGVWALCWAPGLGCCAVPQSPALSQLRGAATCCTGNAGARRAGLSGRHWGSIRRVGRQRGRRVSADPDPCSPGHCSRRLRSFRSPLGVRRGTSAEGEAAPALPSPTPSLCPSCSGVGRGRVSQRRAGGEPGREGPARPYKTPPGVLRVPAAGRASRGAARVAARDTLPAPAR